MIIMKYNKNLRAANYRFERKFALQPLKCLPIVSFRSERASSGSDHQAVRKHLSQCSGFEETGKVDGLCHLLHLKPEVNVLKSCR